MSGGLKILCTVHSEDMVSARSFVGMGRPFRLPAPTGKEEAALVELANMGLTCRPDDHRPGQDDDDRWFLTGKAATVMQVHLRLEQPALVFLGRKGIPLHDKTALELFEDLRGQGFTLLEGQDLSKFKGKAYAGGSGKTQKFSFAFNETTLWQCAMAPVSLQTDVKEFTTFSWSATMSPWSKSPTKIFQR